MKFLEPVRESALRYDDEVRAIDVADSLEIAEERNRLEGLEG